MKLYLPGDRVRVKSWPAIRETLDVGGALDGLPFMEEMLPACGKLFTVWRRIEKTCVESDGMRRLTNTVMLNDARCSGACHGGCEKNCRILWRDAWLEPADPLRDEDNAGTPPDRFPFTGRRADGRYVCQSTELLRVTRPLAKADVRQYVRDVAYRTWTPRDMLRFLVIAVQLRWRVLLHGLASARLRSTLS